MNLTVHFILFLQISSYFVFYHGVSTSTLLVRETGHMQRIMWILLDSQQSRLMDEERCVVGETRVKVLKKDEYVVPFVEWTARR